MSAYKRDLFKHITENILENDEMNTPTGIAVGIAKMIADADNEVNVVLIISALVMAVRVRELRAMQHGAYERAENVKRTTDMLYGLWISL